MVRYGVRYRSAHHLYGNNILLISLAGVGWLFGPAGTLAGAAIGGVAGGIGGAVGGAFGGAFAAEKATEKAIDVATDADK